MLRLYDSRQREVILVQPARRGQLSLHTRGPGPSRPAHLGDLRAVLLADLIRRTAERRQMAVQASLGSSDAGAADGGADHEEHRDHEEHERAFHADCAALGARPPEFTSRSALGDIVDIEVSQADQAGQADQARQAGQAGQRPVARHRAVGGPVLFEGSDPGGPDATATLGELTRRGLDPLALRLAFLERRYRDPLDLTWPALTRADGALRRWRARVAEWATHPSRPLSAEHTAQVTGAFEDDLDTPAALAALRALEDDAAIPPGAKFETFAHVDQLLGLDLASEIGKAPAPARAPAAPPRPA
ncbi:MAG TPA: hypothetical protein VFV41_03735 [Streptosporangiaceae bacterium]|nr:hypothetical protein [Streptosporangiaceae bacterium]